MTRTRTAFGTSGLALLLVVAGCASDDPSAPQGIQEPLAGNSSFGAAGASAGTGVAGSTGLSGVGGGVAGSVGVSTAGAGAAGSVGVSGTGAGAAGSLGVSGAGAGAAGSLGMSGAGGEGSAGGPATDEKPAFVATGMPIMAPDNEWTWIAFPDSKCRDGSPAGIVVNMNSASKKLMLFTEAGGACFETTTCAVSPARISSQRGPAAQGVFDRTQAENPVKDWNFVYVPYCTGDVHLGTNDAGQVEGVQGTQHFVGRLNMEAFLNRLVPTFEDAEQVLVTGTSAGGFAASATLEVVQWAFGSKPDFSAIDDSGPPMAREFLPECLTETWKKLWGLDKGGIISDCGSACSDGGDFEMEILARYLSWAGRPFRFALLEAEADTIIRGFYGIGTNNGANDCKGALLLSPMDATLFRNALLDYRERVKDNPHFSTYYPPGSQHTWLQGASFYTATVGGTRLVDWFKDVLEGKPGSHVGP